MAGINAFTGVAVLAGVAGMSRTLHTAAAVIAAAHPAFPAPAAAGWAPAAAIAPQRKRRTATVASVRGLT
ncbi:hypothetical protein [Mycobacterium hubeiense]|uniref:hypothetical protein n=1 Tax=Mycobacterium hubeiense TaxID=1867256 RepID=UPI000C7F5CC6|nr:hypothetical protein [Mycobacterium sp. QGD 101]